MQAHPEVIRAQQVQADAKAQIAEVRRSRDLTAQAQYRLVATISRNANARIKASREAFRAGRAAELKMVADRLPIGPERARNRTDAAVLAAEFRTALAAVRGMGYDQRQAAYADAERFGDHAMRRALITSELDVRSSAEPTLAGLSSSPILERAAQARDGLGQDLADYRRLSALIAGTDHDAAIAESFAFNPVGRADVDELGRLAPDRTDDGNDDGDRAGSVTVLADGTMVFEAAS